MTNRVKGIDASLQRGPGPPAQWCRHPRAYERLPQTCQAAPSLSFPVARCLWAHWDLNKWSPGNVVRWWLKYFWTKPWTNGFSMFLLSGSFWQRLSSKKSMTGTKVPAWSLNSARRWRLWESGGWIHNRMLHHASSYQWQVKDLKGQTERTR